MRVERCEISFGGNDNVLKLVVERELYTFVNILKAIELYSLNE